jgi:hypothetical protein
MKSIRKYTDEGLSSQPCVSICFDLLAVGDFFLYFFYFCFAKIYGPPEILQFYTSDVVAHGVRGPTAARHGGRGRGPLARAHTIVGHGVRYLTSCSTTVGAYRQAAAWPPGSAASHDGMCGPTAVCSDGRIFSGEFQFLKH